MAEKTKRAKQTDRADQTDQTDLEKTDPLASEAGRAWLKQELEGALFEVEFGPGGQGWQYNESLRAPIEERAAFLLALSEKLEG